MPQVQRFLTVAYNDESSDGRALVVSGLLGTLPEWVELERQWRRLLARHRLPEFHSAKCELRRKPFEQFEREARDAMQHDFYTLVARARLWGYCTAVWQEAYANRLPTFQEHRTGSEGDFSHAYFLAFQHNVEAMALDMDRGGFAADEPIAFVFDRQEELGSRALRLYQSLQYSPGNRITYSHRLGSVSFQSRFDHVQLQAADVWAYESRKYVADVLIDKREDRQRWQYDVFRSTGRYQVWGFPEDSLDMLIALGGDAPARSAERPLGS